MSDKDKPMAMDAILAQLASLKDNARSFQAGEAPDPIWQQDVEACEAATAILTALQDEGINDAEQVKDLVEDYKALARQYQALHAKFEAGAKPERFCGSYICPDCRKQMRPGNEYCWNCGKKLDWRR